MLPPSTLAAAADALAELRIGYPLREACSFGFAYDSRTNTRRYDHTYGTTAPNGTTSPTARRYNNASTRSALSFVSTADLVSALVTTVYRPVPGSGPEALCEPWGSDPTWRASPLQLQYADADSADSRSAQ